MSAPDLKLTQRELELWTAACNCFEQEPKINMDKFAEATGLAKGSAQNAWRNLRHKMGWLKKDESPTKSTPKKRGTTVKDEEGTPSKKARGGKKGGKGKVEEEDDHFFDLEEELTGGASQKIKSEE